MPSQIEKRLRNRRLYVWMQAKELAERAAGEDRAFTFTEQQGWQAFNDELDVLDQRLRAVQDASRVAVDRIAPQPVNPDWPWKAKINFARKDPPPKLPGGCWDLAIPW